MSTGGFGEIHDVRRQCAGADGSSRPLSGHGPTSLQVMWPLFPHLILSHLTFLLVVCVAKHLSKRYSLRKIEMAFHFIPFTTGQVLHQLVSQLVPERETVWREVQR